MNYSQKDFMIKIGETTTGKIIEVPDVIIYGLVLTFVIIIFSIASKKWKYKK